MSLHARAFYILFSILLVSIHLFNMSFRVQSPYAFIFPVFSFLFLFTIFRVVLVQLLLYFAIVFLHYLVWSPPGGYSAVTAIFGF